MHLLITGAGGFIGRHVTARALAEGHAVRATLRDPGRAAELRVALGGPEALEVARADLMDDSGWAEAMASVDAVLHTASPVPTTTPRTDDAVIRPAVEGTRRVLEAAARAGVGRVVVTSSIAAMLGDPRKGPQDLYDERDWTDPERKGLRAYVISKTLAERAAREIAAREGLRLATVNPGFGFGAPLGGGVSSSLTMIDKLIGGEIPLVPRISFPAVTVEDVAEAHLRALENQGVAGEGARLVASGETLWLSEIARVAYEAIGARRRVRQAPDWLVRLAARVAPDVRTFASGLGDFRRTDPGNCEAALGRTLTDPREGIAAPARALAAARGLG
jgi:dihydroflavonol-4-reductase